MRAHLAVGFQVLHTFTDDIEVEYRTVGLDEIK